MKDTDVINSRAIFKEIVKELLIIVIMRQQKASEFHSGCNCVVML